MVQRANGSGILKATGVLMILGGVLVMFFSILATIGIAALDMYTYGEVNLINLKLVYVSSAFAFFCGLIELITGIIGVMNANKPEKATTCVVWGVIFTVLCIIGNVLFIVSGLSFNLVWFGVGLVLPIVFIIGGLKNRES